MAGFIWLLGKRKPAIHNAPKNFTLLVLDDAGMQGGVNNILHVKVDWQWSAGKWSQLAHKLHNSFGMPVLVVACVERAVLPAAYMREALGLAGISSEQAYRAVFKPAMKAFFRANGVAMTEFCYFDKSVGRRQLLACCKLPLVVKLPDSSGGRGMLVYRHEEELPHRLPARRLVEALVLGKEYSVESWVQQGKVLLENYTEYVEPGIASLLPAPLDPQQMEGLRLLNRQVITSLGVQNALTHMEVFYTQEGKWLFGEIALRPPGGMLMELMSLAYGMNAWQVWWQLMLGEPLERADWQPIAHAAVHLIYPSVGLVERIEGLERVRQLSSVVDVHLRLRVGTHIRPRLGVGQYYGYILFRHVYPEVLYDDLHKSRQLLNIKVV